MRFRERIGEESGASLVLALVFVMFIGVGIAALLGLASTNLLATTAIAEQRRVTYAADGAMDAAIEWVRSMNVQCGFVNHPSACSPFQATLNGKAATVTFVGETQPGTIDRSIDLTATVNGVKRIEASIVVQHSQPVKTPVYITRWVYFR